VKHLNSIIPPIWQKNSNQGPCSINILIYSIITFHQGPYSGRDQWITNHTQRDVHFMHKHWSHCRIAQDWTQSWSFATKFCWRTASLMDRNKCGSCVIIHGHKYISRNMSQHVPTAGNMSSTNSSLHGLRHERPSGLCTQCTSAKQTVMARWSKVEKRPTTNLSHPTYPTLLGCLFLIFFGTEFPVLAISFFFQAVQAPAMGAQGGAPRFSP
jgi:hypothetical protein